jgi:hypothetical protein
MKFILSFPEICANIVCPFPMSTWNVVLGSDSTTTPSTSIMSDFAKLQSLLVWIPAAPRSDGSTKLTVGDFFVASDLPGDRALARTRQRHVFAPLALGILQPPPFAVGQQEEVTLCRKHKGVTPLVPAGDRFYDV